MKLIETTAFIKIPDNMETAEIMNLLDYSAAKLEKDYPIKVTALFTEVIKNELE